MVLSKIEKRDPVKNGLDKLFSICHPEYNKNVINGNLAPAITNEDARLNVIKGLGLTAVNNFEVVLDFIKELHAGIRNLNHLIYLAEVIPKKQTGFTSFFSSGGGEVFKENIKITTLQAIGMTSNFTSPE